MATEDNVLASFGVFTAHPEGGQDNLVESKFYQHAIFKFHFPSVDLTWWCHLWCSREDTLTLAGPRSGWPDEESGSVGQQGLVSALCRLVDPVADREKLLTFFGEKTPTVPPSSLMATPISASKASLQERGQGLTAVHDYVLDKAKDKLLLLISLIW